MRERQAFSDDYAEARGRFIGACNSAGCEVRSYAHPLTGPDGIHLSADVTSFGSGSPEKLLLVNSAIHGVEGFCGSAAIINGLNSGMADRIPDNMRVVMIHALNPYGFAWLSRVNEDNIDINRNFATDFTSVPENPRYAEVHSRLLPENWDSESAGQIADYLKQLALKNGQIEMQASVCRGQYQFPDGVFFGGNSTSWSRNVFVEVVNQNLGNVKQVFLVDFHTGLGPYGVPELISSRPVDGFESWFSDKVTCAQSGNAVGPALTGTLGEGLLSLVTEAQVYSITAEFGTRNIDRVLMAIIADNWINTRSVANQSRPGVPLSDPVKQEMRDSFYPDEDEWRTCVLTGSRRILDESIIALSNL